MVVRQVPAVLVVRESQKQITVEYYCIQGKGVSAFFEVLDSLLLYMQASQLSGGSCIPKPVPYGFFLLLIKPNIRHNSIGGGSLLYNFSGDISFLFKIAKVSLS